MRCIVPWLICLVAFATPVRAQERLTVVASFSILGDFVRNVGGDLVNVTTLVGPNADVHVYTPTPADAKTIAGARLVIVNGLGLEGWLPRLVQSAGGKAAIGWLPLSPRTRRPFVRTRSAIWPSSMRSTPRCGRRSKKSRPSGAR